MPGSASPRTEEETPTGRSPTATSLREKAMRLVIYALLAGLLVGFGIGRANAQEEPRPYFGDRCWYKDDHLLRKDETGGAAPTHFCLFAKKEGDDATYAIVLPLDDDEPIVIIRIGDGTQEVVWRKPPKGGDLQTSQARELDNRARIIQ